MCRETSAFSVQKYECTQNAIAAHLFAHKNERRWMTVVNDSKEKINDIIQYVEIMRSPFLMGIEEIQECCEYYIEHKELTDRNVFFLLRYLEHRNKTKAYQDTYFCSKRVANVNTFRLFKKSQVQELRHCLEQQMQLIIGESLLAGRLSKEFNLNGREKSEIYKRLEESEKSIGKEVQEEFFLDNYNFN